MNYTFIYYEWYSFIYFETKTNFLNYVFIINRIIVIMTRTTTLRICIFSWQPHITHHHHHIYLFYQVTSYHKKKTATSSRSITKASKYAIPLKATHKLAELKRYLITWWGDSEGPKGHRSLLPPHQIKIKKQFLDFLSLLLTMIKILCKIKTKCSKDMYTLYSIYTNLTVNM